MPFFVLHSRRLDAEVNAHTQHKCAVSMTAALLEFRPELRECHSEQESQCDQLCRDARKHVLMHIRNMRACSTEYLSSRSECSAMPAQWLP